ncbi:Transcriptional regulatory protein FixJ [Methylocella tundrae]|uniref:Transcriptional regulatory protein FixJ n=1 Tax=Methylocella tundrae TaxID=227605 RepID=A0A8B6M5P4_METTU|nr:response regulator FixJ [Methylocella tundrae]VTZ27080.1 Transcriptional regulatory protein FixJ [Methylocella tundrae]VTZ50331.1 Transcriptional regulatory protein FixJ [Methylocella tundrae]
MASDPVVHLIDDDDGVRQALAFLLTASGFAVRVHESAAAFLDAIATVQPGCVITDVRMPGIDGLELQRQLKARRLGLPVIIMTGHGDVPLAVEAMKAGAIDFLEKPFDDESLLTAVRIALDRHARNARRDDEVTTARAKLASLSARELEVLDGLVAGQPNKTIAYDLNISARTVEVHRANVMTKMGASSLSELVRMVFVVRSAPVD